MSKLISFEDFLRVDIRAGTIMSAEINPKAIKPAYKLLIDFGEEIAHKTSSAQIVQHYTPESLMGCQILAVVNLSPKRVAGVVSEVLVLAVVCHETGTVLIGPTQKVKNGGTACIALPEEHPPWRVFFIFDVLAIHIFQKI